MNSTGAVTLNGTGAGASAAVYDGDSIRNSNGSAEITMPGSAISLRPDSQIVFHSKSVDMNSGSVAVSTSTGLSVQVGNVGVKPASAYTTRYEVTISGNYLTIHAKLGNLVLNSAGNTYDMAEGGTQTIELQQTTAYNNQVPPSVVRSRSNRRVLWLALGAGGAAALGIAAASGNSVSPSKP